MVYTKYNCLSRMSESIYFINKINWRLNSKLKWFHIKEPVSKLLLFRVNREGETTRVWV